MAVAREGNEGDAMNAMSETEEAAFERALVSELRAEQAVEAVEAAVAAAAALMPSPASSSANCA